MDTTVITVDRLSKRYGQTVAVADVSFEVARGEIVGLLGPNGAGKTTIVECLQGLRDRDGGTVTVLGCDPSTDRRSLQGRVGSQLQSSALPDRLRVGEAVGLFAAVGGHPTDVDKALATWDLSELRDRPFGVLSGGQRQRLFLALALLGDPEVVFLDELTTGLDPQARRVTWDLVRAVRERGATIVLVTHLMEEAEALCDRVAIIDEGRLVALDTPAALVSSGAKDMRIVFSHPGVVPDFLADLPGVRTVRSDGASVTVTAAGTSAVLVAAALADRDCVPSDFRTCYPSLEDVFLTATGRPLGS
ncbi:ABC transporter ATP-binding protein [soil metagenome]